MIEPDEVTRRLWLLRFGGGVVLTGLSGVDLDAGEPPLPPGLYQPSIDHLAHVLKPVEHAEVPTTPLFFTSAEYHQILGLVARVLGEDAGTPYVQEISAWIDLLVHDAAAVREAAISLFPAYRALARAFYGDAAVHEMETFDAQQVCRAGLARLRADPSPTLESLETGGDPFIVWLKRRVVEGFYTSQVGLNELDYKGNSFYSISPGCDQ